MLLRSAGAKLSAPLGSGVFIVLDVNVYRVKSSIIKRMISDFNCRRTIFKNRRRYVTVLARQYHKSTYYVSRLWNLMNHYFHNPQYFEDLSNLNKLLGLINFSNDIGIEKTNVKALYQTGFYDVNGKLLYEGDIVRDIDTDTCYRIALDSDYEVCIQKLHSPYWDLDSPDNKRLIFERSYDAYEDSLWHRPWHY